MIKINNMKILIIMLIMLTTHLLGNDSLGENIKGYYISFGLGGASNGYGSDYAESLEENSLDSSSFFLDLGVYFPMDTHLLVGAAVTVSGDSFDGVMTSEKTYDEINYTTSIIGLSLIYFHDYIEEGLFYRGDLGLTTFTATYTEDGELVENSNDDFGVGFLLGFGYAFPFNWGTITTSLLYSNKSINHSTHKNSLNVSTLSFSVGGLF